VRVLVACESSGRVREAFRRRGHEAWSCDLDPAEDGSEWHFQGDVRIMLCQFEWDLVIAHPPCTRLANSGVRWMTDHWVKRQNGGNYWHDATVNLVALIEAAALFNLFKGCAPRVAIENPIPHRYARERIGEYTQIIQPWQFWHRDTPGSGEQKATCLWLHNLPPLVPTTPNEWGRKQSCWLMSPGPSRTRERSRTYLGIADAMAAQWG